LGRPHTLSIIHSKLQFYSCDCGVQLHSKLPVIVQDSLQAATGAYGSYSCTRDPTSCSRDKYLARPHINRKKKKDTVFLLRLACLLRNKSVNISLSYRKVRTEHDEISLRLTVHTTVMQKKRKKCLPTTQQHYPSTIQQRFLILMMKVTASTTWSTYCTYGPLFLMNPVKMAPWCWNI
jgi:hypothetical protein